MHLLLIGREWRPRALIRAELQAVGYDVFAVGSWDEAELLLLKRAIHPDAVVFDLDAEENAPASLRTLTKFVPYERVLVLTQASAMPATEVRAIGPMIVLARPFSVGDVVASVRGLEHTTDKGG